MKKIVLSLSIIAFMAGTAMAVSVNSNGFNGTTGITVVQNDQGEKTKKKTTEKEKTKEAEESSAKEMGKNCKKSCEKTCDKKSSDKK